MTAYWVSCMFQSCAPSPNNAKSREAQAPAEPEMRIVVKRKLTVGGLIGHLASVLHFHKRNMVKLFLPDERKIEFVYICFVSHMQFLFGILFQVLCCPFSNVTGKQTPKGMPPAHLHFPNKTIQRCAQFPNNSRTIAVAAKSFPAPVSNVVCSIVLR